MDSKDIIKLFLDTHNQLYSDIQMIIHAICSSCVSVGIESNAESAISLYNIHNTYLRPLSDDCLENEMIVSFNGPPLSQSDSIIRNALTAYFMKNKVLRNAHFITNLSGRRKFLISKVVDRHKKLVSRLPFMV